MLQLANMTKLSLETFASLQNSFKQGLIDKRQFNNAMADKHKSLFEYHELIRNSNVKSITITESEIISDFVRPRIRISCPYGDCRSAALGALTFGDYEPNEINIVVSILNLLGDKIRFFDIGANVGLYSVVLSTYFPTLEGFAFEPIPSTFSCLRRNFELNEISKIQPLNLGLSDKSGEFLFYSYPSHLAASSLAITVDSSDREEIKCNVTTIDQFCLEHNQTIDFIKCDVEGSELNCFIGGLKTLTNDLPVVFTEMLRKWSAKFNYHPNEIIKLFINIGYTCFDFSSGKLVKFEKMDDETIATNFIFLHSHKHRFIIERLM